MAAVRFIQVDGDFGRRQAEYQLPFAGVDMRKLQHIPEKLTVSVGVFGIDDRVCTVYPLVDPFRVEHCRE